MSLFKAVIEAWPHSTGEGSNKDQERAGPRKNTFLLQAENMKDAVYIAGLIAQGIEVNPMVWQAPIVLLERKEF